MLVHAVWAGGRAGFWAEGSPRPATSEIHPFAEPPEELEGSPRRSSCAFRPDADGPVHSSFTTATHLREWSLPAVFPDALPELEEPSGSVRFLAALDDFARDLVRRGRVLPGLVGDEARWRPVLTGADATRAAELAAAMPPVFRSADARRARELLSEALMRLADRAVRQDAPRAHPLGPPARQAQPDRRPVGGEAQRRRHPPGGRPRRAAPGARPVARRRARLRRPGQGRLHPQGDRRRRLGGRLLAPVVRGPEPRPARPPRSGAARGCPGWSRRTSCSRGWAGRCGSIRARPGAARALSRRRSRSTPGARSPSSRTPRRSWARPGSACASRPGRGRPGWGSSSPLVPGRDRRRWAARGSGSTRSSTSGSISPWATRSSPRRSWPSWPG